jgi:hypothetical protein
MLRRFLILVTPILMITTLTITGAAQAAEKDAPKVAGQYVDLQPVAMPVVIDGQLVNYVFVYVRVNLKSGADVIKIREKEPFFRDALVRDAHRTPFIIPTNWQKIDEAKLVAAMTRDAIAITGPGVVASVSVISQTPQKLVRQPPPPQPAQP